MFHFVLITVRLSTQVHYTFLKKLYERLTEGRVFQTNFVQNCTFQRVL